MYKMGLNSIFFIYSVEKNRNRVNMSIKLKYMLQFDTMSKCLKTGYTRT